MEKNLGKYVTIEEAAKLNYITAQMIFMLVEKNQIPFFSEKGNIRIFPGDITQIINEMFGVTFEDRKKKRKEPIPETSQQEIEPLSEMSGN